MEGLIRIVFIFLLSVMLLAGPIDGRVGPEEYWAVKTNGQSIPEAIKEFINEGNKKGEAIEGFLKEFDPIPNASIYHDDVNPKEMRSQKADCNSRHGRLASKKLGVDTFEPRPNLSVYND